MIDRSKYIPTLQPTNRPLLATPVQDAGKQVYLGGFYNEEQAALAYDLAAVRFRGEGAATNFPAAGYAAELAARRVATREQVVACLRAQSKAMNKVEAGPAAARLEPWELALVGATVPATVHLGVFATEAEAARAVDRALLAARGLAAAPALNFQLCEYLDALAPAQVAEGVARGLLPAALPADFAPAPPPRPVAHAGAAALPPPGGAGGAAPPGVERRLSITPRSVLDFDEGEEGGGEGAGDKRSLAADAGAGADDEAEEMEESEPAPAPAKRRRGAQ